MSILKTVSMAFYKKNAFDALMNFFFRTKTYKIQEKCLIKCLSISQES